MFPLFRSILYWAFSTRLNFNIGNQTSPLFRLWLYLILPFFFNLQITIQDISAKTSLHPQDVALTFMLLGLVRKNLQNKFIMAIDWSRVDQHMERVKASLASRTRYVHSGPKYTLLIQYSNGSKLSNHQMVLRMVSEYGTNKQMASKMTVILDTHHLNSIRVQSGLEIRTWKTERHPITELFQSR